MYPVTYMLATTCQDFVRPQVLDTLHMPNILFHPTVTCIMNKHPCIVLRRLGFTLDMAEPSPNGFSSSWHLWPTCSSSTNEHAEAVSSAAACCALIELSWLSKHRLLSTWQLWYAAYRQQCFCWSGELLHWNMLWGGCSNSELVKLYNSGDSTCLTVTCKLAVAQLELCYLLTCVTKSQVSTGCPVLKTNHIICNNNRTWSFCLVTSFCHVWSPSGHC